MDNARYTEDEYTAQSTTYGPEPAHGNGMFSSSHHFTVTAQSLVNITKNYTNAPSVPSDVRIFALGDIDLQYEIRVDAHTGIAHLEHERRCVRRLYSTRIADRRSKMTAVLYQGNGAEEEWRQDVAKYMTVRHPNIIQITGVATSGGIHAALFTDDLIPFNEFLALQQFSHFSLVYFYIRCNWDYVSLEQYFDSTFQKRPSIDCSKWIRRSTGKVCAELHDDDYSLRFHGVFMHALPKSALIRSNPEIAVIDLLTIRDYHEICAGPISLWRPLISHLAPTREITVGAVLCGAAGDALEDPAEIAVLENPDVYRSRWEVSRGDTQIMDNDWTRLNSHDVQQRFSLYMSIPFRDSSAWLSQANHIFRRLGIVSNFENYVVVDKVSFHLNLSPSDEDTPPGFLFLCPEEDFQTGPASFRWPELPAYWSLDPFGADCLSPAESTRLGFPLFELTTEIRGGSWVPSVYDGLRKFHQAKGFDPYSQDIALHLGHQLYQLSSEVNKEDYWDSVYGYYQSSDALFAENMVFFNIQLALILFLGISWLYEQM